MEGMEDEGLGLKKVAADLELEFVSISSYSLSCRCRGRAGVLSSQLLLEKLHLDSVTPCSA